MKKKITMKNRTCRKKNRGVATILVLSSIAILSFVIYEFAFESQLTNFRIKGQQHKLKARMNAEAGLRFAMAKLKLYREGYNLIEKDTKIKDMISPEILESIITTPFVYPIPLSKDANLIQKNAIADFEKNNLIEGGISVEISPVSGFLNPNNMRVKKADDMDETGHTSEDENKTDDQKLHSYVEQEILRAMENAFEEKKEKDENFNSLYGDIEPKILIKELKYYVTNKEDFKDSERGEVEGIYFQKGITPKHGPLTSISELYLLEGWKDDLVELIKDRLTVHEVSIIPLNKITESQLKILFPVIEDEQIKEFFKYRDGTPTGNEDPDNPEDLTPAPFKSEADFKALIVDRLGIVDEQGYTSRMEELKKAGLVLGVAGKLFRISSMGTFNDSVHTINAYVDLPLKPVPTPTPTPTPMTPPKETTAKSDTTGEVSTPDAEKTPPPQELLEPRVIEIM
ncbi:MAG: hypothetical protein KAQ98_13100 [Bacteriovoracaceae bacterium]|nr:hypothetical protein [Bacteriovoracaceae bacterium]